jgi:hypothetical protein
MPQPQNKYPLLRDFIAHFVLTDDQPAHLAGCKVLELFTTARVFAQLSGGRGEGAYDLRGGLSVNLGQKSMQPSDISERLACPPYPHDGTGSGLSVSRLSTQFSTSS